MSLQEFIEDVVEGNQPELSRLRELSEILDSLRDEESEIYMVSTTSDL